MHDDKALNRVAAAAPTLTLAIGLAMTIAVAHAQPAGTAALPSQKPKHANNIYIVQMAEQPAASYSGGVRGYAATKPVKGQKLDPAAPGVYGYMGYLASKQNAAMASVGASKKIYNYGYVFNGFAAELTAAQAQKLAQTPGVLAVSKDELHQPTTSTTPAFLGLSGAGGFWDSKSKGEHVVIGVVDSGIWPEHPSFSDVGSGNGNSKSKASLYTRMPKRWSGTCTPGEEFTTSDCNNKLIGARYYNAGFGGNTGIDSSFPFEFNSPRDWGGHGSHTASTAGGNSNVAVTGPAAPLGAINGIAPRARVAVYKVCWADQPTGGGCFGSDSVAAIDQAVADGVDVINYSISGTSTNFRDPVEIAFLNAANAGVFVAASAGNSGPTTSTVAHPSPWITTVAAGTHNRNGAGSTTLGNGASYSGASFAAALGAKPLVDAVNVGASGASASAVELCTPGALDPAAVTGKVVLCKRGAIALVDKSRAVFEAGGAGMLLYNDPAGATNTLALIHSVPTVHLDAASGLAIKSYVATTGATASIAQSTIVFDAPAPLTASFSSRGPLRASANLLKPDLIAPGQDILAAVAPPNNGGKLFDLYSGTSMSSPHVAGMAALLKALHPDWSPMAIKSALMTTGSDVLDSTSEANRIFRQGAGHVRPNLAADPGLVFDSGYADWLGFLCGTQLPASFCTSAGVPVLDPSDFNGASIALGSMPGSQTITRRVTNVGGNPATYAASTSGLAGIGVTMNPASLSLAAGETKSFTLTFTNASAALNAYVGGQLTLSDGLHNVRLPVVIRPVLFSAPTEVSGSYSVKFGYTGAFSASARGLVPAATASGSVATGGQLSFTVNVPAGSTYARFSLFDSEVSQPSDLDLQVVGPGVSGSSGNGTSAEEVNFVNPPAGNYTVYVLGYAVPVGSADFKLFSWALGSTAAGNMAVTAPGAATAGQSGAIGIVPSGLTSGTKYLGSVAYGGTAGLPAPTIVRIDAP